MNQDTTALMFLDMQNDFLHADGAYARGGATSDHLAVLPATAAFGRSCAK